MDESESSPLRLFANAKHKLIDCFIELEDVCEQMCGFLASLDSFNHKVHCDVPVINHLDKVQAILKIISRNNMKVVFFGRTSNGKSTVINSILRNEILPAGLGHTTNCFLQICGTDQNESSFTLSGSNTVYQIQDLDSFNGEDSDTKVNINEMISIYWPRNRCDMLKEDIVLIDSPGIDVSANLDSWIEKHCMDADVFVLVSNAESVLSRTEKNFFFSVRDKLSNPNIFILNNRWDAAAGEADGGQRLRRTHETIEISFLRDELRVCSDSEEASRRIYFVSAKETLADRTGINRSFVTDLPGQDQRLADFAAFEHEFTSCLSKTAVATKFGPHATKGQLICSQIKMFLDAFYLQCAQEEKQVALKYDETIAQINLLERRLGELTVSAKSKIRHVAEIVESKVCQALEVEIEFLSQLLNEFRVPFGTDPAQVDFYKRELNVFVEQKLGEKMGSRLGAVLLSTLDKIQLEIKGEILNLVPQSKQRDVDAIMSRTDFSSAYRFYCSNICSEFKEDICFRFSLSPTVIITRLLKVVGFDKFVGPDQNSTNEHTIPSSVLGSGLLAIQSMNVMSSSANGMIILTVSSVVWKGIGWRILLACCSAYGLLFAYERIRWNRTAQEALLKKQYVNFAANKLYSMSDMISGNASHQVQEELSLYFAQMCQLVDQSKDEYLDKVGQLKESRSKWSLIARKTAKIREHATRTMDILLQYTREFLEP